MKKEEESSSPLKGNDQSVITFRWDDFQNRFQSPIERIDEQMIRSPRDQENNKLFDLVTTIEGQSGIKKDSCFLLAAVFIVCTSIGFGLSYYLITNSYSITGGIIIVFTAMATFFGIVGYSSMRGDQVSRVNQYLQMNFSLISNNLSEMNFQFIYSFNIGKH